MTKIFRSIVFLSLIATTHFSFSQNKDLNTLIEEISNKDAYIILTKNMSPRTKGEASKEIIAFGKKATPQLIQILDTENKGIVAHFILCKIWKESFKEAICCNISGDGNLEILTINGLEIQIENDELFSTEANLKKNKLAWVTFTHV